jgi:hypothetical protein
MSLPRRLVAEGLGTSFLLAVVIGSGIMGERLAGGNVAIALLANSLATGGGLVVLILIFGPVSGAHFNPAVTLAAATQGVLPWREVVPYIALQVLGAFAGVAAAHLMFGEPLFFASLRACLKRSRSGCQTPHHQLNHGDPNPCLGRLRQGLEVFTQPPRAIEPAKGAFDDPAPLHHVKALGMLGAFHDHESPLQHGRDPGDELASVPAIGPDQLQAREAGDQRRQHLFSSISVLDPR